MRSPDTYDDGVGTCPRDIPRLLAATGDPGDPSVMSGLPYHFRLYGMRAGLIDGVATRSIDRRALAFKRYAWNAYRVLSLQGKGGHQYSDYRTTAVWLPLPESTVTVINIFQLYPPRLLADKRLRRWYFIDQTLQQLFDLYGQGARIGRGIESRTIAQERAGYAAAETIIVNSQWAAESVTGDYGIEPERVEVVPQAANFDPDVYDDWARARSECPPQRTRDELRLVFLGGDWYRKGLDRLLRALAKARSAGAAVTLDVIGCNRNDLPADLRNIPGVTWHGYINKLREQRRFLDLVASGDVGCLLSRAEAGGNALREYHALGLAVLGTTAGGAPEQTLPSATWLVDVTETDDDVADRLCWLARDRGQVDRYKAAAWKDRESTLWPATLAQLANIFAARDA